MKVKQSLMNFTLYSVAWILHKSYRYRYFNYQNRIDAQAAHPTGASALAIWHGNSFIGTLAHTYQPFAPLCSMSPDGMMVAFLCRRMGLAPVLGSSSKGGKEARHSLAQAVGKGRGPAITVDGPKGPARKAKNGIVDVARKNGLAILPAIATADRFWQLKSWDRLKIPKPFAKIAVCYGTPIQVPSDTTGEAFDAYREQVDLALNNLEKVGEEKLKTWLSDEATLTFAKVCQGPETI